MVSVLTPSQINRTFQLRMGLLGKSAFPPSGDPDEPPTVVMPNMPEKPNLHGGRKPHQFTMDEQEYTALYSEGSALYQRKEYARAIEAFSKANDITVDKPNPNILIDRADCYIQIGQPELALADVNKVLSESKNNPRAILTKAEAYFSMGEFEFALVFFERGLSIRKDMSGFRDGVTKAKHAILDAIHGENVFQPNPNYATSRPRKPLVQTRELPKEEHESSPDEQTQQQQDYSKLLPEKVPPLASTEEKENYLGELSLDYEFLRELQSELNDPQYQSKEGEKENEEMKKIVNSTLQFLQQRGAFWSQQGRKEESTESNEDGNKTRSRGNTAKSKSGTLSSPKGTTTSEKRASRTTKGQQPHYEMSKLQQYENKYPSKTKKEE